MKVQHRLKSTSDTRDFFKEKLDEINKSSFRPVLSISLLCAGMHPEETSRCLDSLQAIKGWIPTEIIIVDTGCNEKMQELITRNADKVIPFKWCDDFAKARNAGLRECTGEWFMYIDDDEWFDDVSPIVSFFTSGEYRNFDNAYYMQRNYSDKNGQEYDSFWVGRLTKLTKDTHFYGRIHEYLCPFTGRNARLNAFVHHYGYVYENEKDHYAKARRNIKPLYEMIKEDPNNLHWYTQLVNEFMSINEIGDLNELCEDMIKQTKDIDDPYVNMSRTDFYHGKIWADIHSYQYRETITDFNTFRKDRRNNSVCQATLYLYAATAYCELKEYDNAIRYAERYIDIYDGFMKYEDAEVRIGQEASLTNSNIFSSRRRSAVISTLMLAAIKNNDADTIERYIDRFSRIKDDGSQFDYICKDMVNLFADGPFDERFIRFADIMLSFNISNKHCMHFAMQIEEEEKKKHNERFDNILKVFGQTHNGSNYYLHYMKVRYEDKYVTDSRKFKELYTSLVLMTSDFFNLDPSVWQIADEKDIDLRKIFKEIPFFKWQNTVDTYMEKHGGRDSRDVRKMMSQFDNDDDIRFRYFRLKALEGDITNAPVADAAGKLADYSRDCIDFYKGIYKEEQFEENAESSVLLPQCMFAVRFCDALKTGRFDECTGIYPPFDDALDEYISQAWKKYLQSLSSDKRKKLLYSTDLNQSPETVIKKTKSVLFYFSHFSDRILFIWHSDETPEDWTDVDRTEYERMIDEFRNEGWGLYDSSMDISTLIDGADALYGDDERLMNAAQNSGKALLKENACIPVTDQNIVFDESAIPPGIPDGMNVIQESASTDIALFTQMLLLGRLTS